MALKGNIVSGGANGGNGGTSYRFGTALNGEMAVHHNQTEQMLQQQATAQAAGVEGGVTAYGHNPDLAAKGLMGMYLLNGADITEEEELQAK